MVDISIYDPVEYFFSDPGGFEEIAWNTKQLRYGTQTDAVGYALGLGSMEKIREVLGYDDDGKSNHPILGAKKQLELIWQHKRRVPFGTLFVWSIIKY